MILIIQRKYKPMTENKVYAQPCANICGVRFDVAIIRNDFEKTEEFIEWFKRDVSCRGKKDAEIIYEE